MKTPSKEEIQYKADLFVNEDRFREISYREKECLLLGFNEGAEWMEQQLEPLITELELEKARKTPQSVEVMTLEECLNTEHEFLKELGISPDHISYFGSKWYVTADFLNRYSEFLKKQSRTTLKDHSLNEHPEDVLFKYVSEVYNLGDVVNAMEEYAKAKADQLQAELEQVKAENQKLIKDKEIVDFIMDIDWMGTKEFCDKHHFPVPFMVTNNPIESARMFIDVDMKRWHVIKDFAKSKRKEALQSTKQ